MHQTVDDLTLEERARLIVLLEEELRKISSDEPRDISRGIALALIKSTQKLKLNEIIQKERG